ncbi:hypothetical protein H6G89_15705 [Oscillatoria sp. FACHB-1407]|uniref:hypothetical protein n=1 Tax=Oscillatoria sp. FACHB-1407 TaxID=2692847 RepID=UPI0016869519|nr:hypothetical protein [Oscillatoria sp. FACHB-1407]MBD2462491.1 hypothetical protein [Oscillatoria sp. FACHB-1407]
MSSNIQQPLQVNSTLSTLLTELGEECEKVVFLLSQLKLATLTDDQKGDILAELVGSVTHLHVHTENLPESIEDEILMLPDEPDDED